jgi:sugar/nucleoside kinase (ribokinase family)
MSILAVGSVALDSVATPYGVKEDVLGGAACFFSVAAAFFDDVRLVGVVGDDFPERHVETLRARRVDLAGLERRAGEKTFRWTGLYEGRMDSAKTLKTELNVLGAFKPTIPASWRATPYVFLANGDPVTQAHVLDQLEGPSFTMVDTMNLWIDTARDKLLKVWERVDGVVLNDEEARTMGESQNLVRAMNAIAARGVRLLVVKKGEHGSVMLKDGEFFALPAYPLEDVRDPTGAGDTFAAGFMGRVAESGDTSWRGLKEALAYGTTAASFAVESFSLDRLLTLDRGELDRRKEAFLSFTRY